MRLPSYFKRATESLYDCVADVYILKENEVPEDGFDDEVPKVSYQKIYQAMPCRVSTKSLGPVSSNEGIAPSVKYEVRLYCDFDYEIPAGSRFVVTNRNGRIIQYKNSGEPFTNYQTHQSISIERVKFI